MQVDGDKLDIREMALKCTSKSEVYTTLTVIEKVYFPPKSDINWDYISDILVGRKDVS